MLPIHAIQKVVAGATPDLQEVVIELRNLVAEIAPGVTEKMHSRGFSYYFAEHGGPVKAGLCQVNLHTDHIRLGFIHGAFLPDPKGLLMGEPRYKKYLRIDSFDQADWDYCRQLIQASSHFDVLTHTVREWI